uniref:Ig-like domain-containing protein n=1 Tax=Myripristis murdjan TaxID=586833 RepID=A0A667XD10_9TELE
MTTPSDFAAAHLRTGPAYFGATLEMVHLGCNSAQLTKLKLIMEIQISPSQFNSALCTASSAIDDDLAWHHQKPGGAPKFIMTFSSGFTKGRYKGSGYDIELNLTISNVQAEDSGVYYCQQHDAFPFTQ